MMMLNKSEIIHRKGLLRKKAVHRVLPTLVDTCWRMREILLVKWNSKTSRWQKSILKVTNKDGLRHAITMLKGT